jgi:hypothetical protein
MQNVTDELFGHTGDTSQEILRGWLTPNPYDLDSNTVLEVMDTAACQRKGSLSSVPPIHV